MEDFYKPCKSSEHLFPSNNGYSIPCCSVPSMYAATHEDGAVSELHNIPAFRERLFLWVIKICII